MPARTAGDLEPFPATHWTLVASAGRDGPSRRQALTELLRRYLGPMKTHLVVRLKLDADQADDLLQGFLASQVLERHLIRGAQRNKGRFRSFLLVALHRYIANQFRDQRAQKRAPMGGRLVSLEISPLSRERGPSEAFDLAWAKEVLQRALRRMKEDCDTFRRPELWGVFEQRIVRPILDGSPAAAHVDLVRQFRLASPEQAANLLITAKRMFARCLRSVVGEYEPDNKRIDTEIADLRRLLAKPGL